MADRLTAKQRSGLMKRVRTKDTAPELALRRALWARGVRGWRVDVKTVPGRPDLVWRRRKLAVFVDGAFWHGHPDHYYGQSGPFWDRKIQRNRQRDREINRQLQDDGWTVVRFWDFEVEKSVDQCVETVMSALGAMPGRTIS